MNKLQEIKDQVARERGHASYNSLHDDVLNEWLSVHNIIDLWEEVSRRYATEVAKATLERAAQIAGVKYYVVGAKTFVSEITTRVDKQSITSIEIELI